VNSSGGAVQTQGGGFTALTNREQLGYYLAGLIEGDGSIIVPEQVKAEKVRYPSFKIAFHLNNLTWAEKIREVLGFGTISFPKGKNYGLLTFYSKEGVITMINLINGKMRTPKIEALHRAINLVNLRGFQSDPIPLLPLDTSPLGSNAWFSGFTDSDGCFEVVSMTNFKKELTGFKCRFSLEQRLEYHRDCKPFSSSYLGVLQAIASEFNGTLVNISRKRSYGTSLSVLVRTSSKDSNTLLDLYFSKFPLAGGKRLDYQEWSKVLALIIKGRHQTKEGLQISLEAKESMNSYRSSWNWEHLSTFYTLQKPPHPLAGRYYGYAVSVW